MLKSILSVVNMMTDGYVIGDGSWTLRIGVTEFNVEKKLRVKGDLHIGGVMLKLVEDLDIATDWSDHALWWPSRNKWLTRTRFTLDQYEVQADAVLHFTPMHKVLRLQLPDLRYLDCKVDFSIKTFNAVVQLCKELGIRHPEELSLCKPLEAHHLKCNWKDAPSKKHLRNANSSSTSPDTSIVNQSPASSTGSLDRTSQFICAPLTPVKRNAISTPISSPVTPTGTWKRNGYSEINGNVTTLELLNGNLETSLAHSPMSPSHEARGKIVRPKSLIEKARMNVGWLDSSLSIMEQGIHEFEALSLRYKFYSFYDLNPKTDGVRINMIYEHAKWMLLNEELDYTEEEALMFAALQVQINLQTSIPQLVDDTCCVNGVDDDIDAALNDLQVTLQGSNILDPNEITHVPELYDYLRFLKPKKKLTLRGYKRFWFACNDLKLRLFKSQISGIGGGPPVHIINLKGCEVTPDVNLAQNKFIIKLEVPSAEGMTEMWIRCDTEEQYAKWMAACRLAAKGRTLSDNTYESEVESIINFLEMQRPAPTAVLSPSSLDITSEDYISPKYCKKLKNKAVQKILEAHTNVKELTLTEAKQNYIKAWQSLPDFGVSLFVVRFMGAKKDELLGIASNRIMRMDLNTGDHIKTWRYNTIKEWHVNWEIRHMMVQFEEGNIEFACLSADCKVVHEFIGGYIFLSTRSKEANQSLNEDLFHKLTGGWM